VYKIYSAENLQAAYLIQSLLAEAGIETRILNEYAQGGIGDISFAQAYPEIWLLDDTDAESAQSVVDHFERRNVPISTIVCPNCKEPNPDTFEVCWRCKIPLVDAASTPE